MELTNRAFVTTVLESFKLSTKDSAPNREEILFRGITAAKYLITQKLAEGSLSNDDSILTSISCFELESVDSVQCQNIAFNICQSIMRSTKKLPEILTGKTGPKISVIDLGGETYDYIAPDKYLEKQRNKRLSPLKKKSYFSIDDNHLILPNSMVESVNVKILTLYPYQTAGYSSCGKQDCCKSNWDYPFVCPDTLEDAVVKMVQQSYAQFTARSIEDENANLDSNSKSITQE